MASSGSPCGACKFLRRKCAPGCIFAPYFSSEQGAARFAAIHKVFGASNVSKLLLHVPVRDRCEAVVSIAYEAQARIRDPVYGCVAHIFSLQQQVACLQAQLLQVKGQLAQHAMNSHDMDGQWEQNLSGLLHSIPNYPISPQTSLESVEVELNGADAMNMQEMQSIENFSFHGKRPCDSDLGELQAIALRMMRN